MIYVKDKEVMVVEERERSSGKEGVNGRKTVGEQGRDAAIFKPE